MLTCHGCLPSLCAFFADKSRVRVTSITRGLIMLLAVLLLVLVADAHRHPQPGRNPDSCAADSGSSSQWPRVVAAWKSAFPDAALLPTVGEPDKNGGVLLLAHTMGLGKLLKIDGLTSMSPLANSALYSAESIQNKTFNIYEILVPDIPGTNGSDSTVQIYVRALVAHGLIPSGNHFHWTGEYVFPGGGERDHNVAAVHHQEYGMDALSFSRRTIAALQVLVSAIRARAVQPTPDVPDATTCGISDALANDVVLQWRSVFPDAMLLPVVGLPSSNNDKLAVLTHMGMEGPPMMVNGLSVKSPLANNALYSFECSANQFLHLYEIMLPDIVGPAGARSTVQIYVNALRDNGLDVAGLHWHFYGGVAMTADRGVLAIHHQNVGLSPSNFTTATLAALQLTLNEIAARAKK